MIALLFLLAQSVPPVSVGTAPDAGQCAWDRMPPPLRDSFRQAYGRGMQAQGMATLETHDAELKAGLDACLPAIDRGAPEAIRSGLIGSAAIRDGAVAELAKGGGPSRKALERIWSAAPEAARICARANAGRMFGQVPSCPDSAAPVAFLTAAGLDIRKDTARGAQVLFFMNATAQTEWKLGFIKAYEAACASPAGCPKAR